MAKNRSSNTDVLAGLTNLKKQSVEETLQEELIEEAPKEKEEVKVTTPVPTEATSTIVRKKTKTEEANKFTVYLDDRQYLFLKKNGWEYNGMNGFIKHLIDEEIKRRGE